MCTCPRPTRGNLEKPVDSGAPNGVKEKACEEEGRKRGDGNEREGQIARVTPGGVKGSMVKLLLTQRRSVRGSNWMTKLENVSPDRFTLL